MQYTSWNAQFDASCMDTHAATDNATWKCADRHHVLLNHITTPIFFREDFTDPNPEHLNGGKGHSLLWARCTNFVVCPTLNTAGYREHLEEQVQTLLDGGATRSELGRGIDVSGAFPTIFAWMPACASHNGAYDDVPFFTTAIRDRGVSYTMRQWLEKFMAVSARGEKEWRIDGWSDGTNGVMTSQCAGTGDGRRRAARP